MLPWLLRRLLCLHMHALCESLQMKLIHVRLRMLGAGSTVISGGLGALGSLAASWLLAGATGSHALVLLGRTGRLRLGGGMSFSGPPNQAGLLACAHMLALLLCMVFRHILLQGDVYVQAMVSLARSDLAARGNCAAALAQLQSARCPALACVLHGGGVLKARNCLPGQLPSLASSTQACYTD